MTMGPHVAPAPAPYPPSHDEMPINLQDRVTKSGRRLWYKLTVIQQPVRARACGSGPKSSADRRPVDPPPVVELRIFEGNSWHEAEQHDITFLYNANFFLFATLEHARVIAHGRVQTPAANQPPVLTGMPVSGMAYLDRPNEAGYFLFPDLSVRHEGRYRLNFNLYEETKEDKDKDPDTPDANIIAPGFVNATGGSFDFRMDVKSDDFTVFSAKKFPGLTESTTLSRVVAEQGCRVRIRRDVRMRRRDGKPIGSDYDNGKEEYAKQKRTETPEVKPNFRARSTSGSVERSSFSAESQRRPSGADYPSQYPSQPPSASGHLQFLGNSAAQFPPQSQSHTQPPSMPPSPSYQTSHGGQFPSHPAAYQPQHQQIEQQNAQPAHQVAHQPMHQPSYPSPHQQQSYQSYQSERSQPQQYVQTNPSPKRETAPREFRDPAPPQYREAPQHEYRDSAGPQQLYRQPSKEYILPPPMAKPISSYSQPQLPPRANTPLTLPPIHDLTRNVAPHAMLTLSSPTSDRMPPLQSMPPPKSTAPLPLPPSIAGSKRSRDDSSRYEFDTPRYHNGAREDPQLLDENGEPMLIYRRANGAEIEVNHDFI